MVDGRQRWQTAAGNVSIRHFLSNCAVSSLEPVQTLKPYQLKLSYRSDNIYVQILSKTGNRYCTQLIHSRSNNTIFQCFYNTYRKETSTCLFSTSERNVCFFTAADFVIYTYILCNSFSIFVRLHKQVSEHAITCNHCSYLSLSLKFSQETTIYIYNSTAFMFVYDAITDTSLPKL